MATNNNLNNTSAAESFSTTTLNVDPGASGDSYIQFDINTTGEWRIGVDDTDDSLRLSQGSALGTNDTFIMTAAGERTMPLQPAFSAIPSGTLSNVTGDATKYTIVFATENLDQGSDYNSATGVFTAPVAGNYKFVVSVDLTGITSSMDNDLVFFDLNATGGFNYAAIQGNMYAVSVSGATSISGSYIFDLAASDTISAVAWFIGGTKVVDILASSSFAGYLAN